MLSATNEMFYSQSEALRALVHGEIGDAEYTQCTKESEQIYRNKVADALAKLTSKSEEASDIIHKLNPESDVAKNATMLGKNLSTSIEGFRGGRYI